MNVTYYLYDPSGNITILVETPVPAEERAAVAARLMEREPAAEQVGFLWESEDSDIALCMAGGEFCGNATMSAAAVCAAKAGLEDGTVLVDASGAPHPVAVALAAHPDGSWSTTLDMPTPRSVQRETLPDGTTHPVVRFTGIAHVLLEQDAPDTKEARDEAVKTIRDWCEALGVEALGLLYLDRAQKRLTPLVYVPAVNTTFWESACGSGTAAVGAYLAKEANEPVDLALRQPGGTLSISASPNGPLRMSGTVTCLKQGQIE